MKPLVKAGLGQVKEKTVGQGQGGHPGPRRRGGGGGKGKKLKVTNIVEQIDVGAPLRLAYDQWTQFEDFPSFMKKVEDVEQESRRRSSSWKAQVFWSHRKWRAEIIEQVPDKRIVWRSEGREGPCGRRGHLP